PMLPLASSARQLRKRKRNSIVPSTDSSEHECTQLEVSRLVCDPCRDRQLERNGCAHSFAPDCPNGNPHVVVDRAQGFHKAITPISCDVHLLGTDDGAVG